MPRPISMIKKEKQISYSLSAFKRYTGIKSDADAIRFAITFTYRKLIEMKKD